MEYLIKQRNENKVVKNKKATKRKEYLKCCMILLFSACVTIAPKTFLNFPNWSVEKLFFPGETFLKKGIFAIKKLLQH